MVIKVKEITIGRSQKWAWDFGNSVGYNISVTIEGTTSKDTPEDMKRVAMNELLILLDTEQERCRNVYDIAQLQEGMEYKEAVEKSHIGNFSGVEKSKIADDSKTKEPAVRKASPGFRNSTPAEEQQFKEETLEITEEVLMDLTEVTVMALTDKAVLFSKKGYQKWVPFSTMESGVPLEKGKYLEDIELTDAGKGWIPDKSWEPLKLMKGGGS